MAGFAIDIAMISAFTVLAILFGSWWIYKRLNKQVAKESEAIKSDECFKKADVVLVKDLDEFRRIISGREKGEISPLAIHGKDLNMCYSKSWAEGIGCNILRKYLTEIISQNSESLQIAMQEAIKMFSRIYERKSDNEVQDISDDIFSTSFTVIQLIAFGHTNALQSETLRQMEQQLKIVIKLWPKCSLRGNSIEKCFLKEKETEFEDSKEKLSKSITLVLKTKLESTVTSKEAYADYILNSYTTECKDEEIKIVSNHIADLLVLGVNALSDALKSGVIRLLDEPRVQEKVSDEITKFRGHRLSPTELLENKNLFPFARAVIREVIRMAPTPAALFQENQGENPEAEKNDSPKIIAADLQAILTDRKIWKNPDAFDPDRFLDPLRKNLIQKEEYVPFCTGDRSCPADALVETTLFVVIAYLVQKFHLKRPVGSNSNDLQADDSGTTTAADGEQLKLIVTARNSPEKTAPTPAGF